MTDQSDFPDKVLSVQMLGGFRISVDGYENSDTTFRTKQLWSLLEYLIAFRHKTISNDDLIATLWPDDSSDNPANALKNLVYRIRTIFKSQQIPYSKEIIISKHGSYSWNNALPCQVDCEQFEELYKSAGKSDLSPRERIDRYQKAIALYKGDFLPRSSYEEWVVPISAYYHGLYFKCVYEAIDLLLQEERFEEIETICTKALTIDQFEESAHKYLIQALMKQGKSTQALAHYNKLTDLFYRELGVTPSDSIRSLYRQITKTVNSVEIDLEVIKEDLNESSHVTGAYYCDYEVFRNMYRVEARSAARSGQSIFIGLLTVTDKRDQVPEVTVLNRSMDRLLSVINSSLRRGDIVSRFSATQYVLMLPTLTYENGQMVMERLMKRYRQEYRNDTVNIHWKLLPLDPV